MALPFRPSYGVGQSQSSRLPTFAPQRQTSATGSSPNALQSPSFGRTVQNPFPFGAAGMAISPTPASANVHGTAPGPPPAEANLDPSDFPALGSGASNNVTSSSAPGFVSSYASQAGTGSLTGQGSLSQASGSGSGGLPSGAVQGLTAREFSADDFPALGGFGVPVDGVTPGSGQSNGMLMPGANGRVGAMEQASAAAALQTQQQQNQYRSNLLGNVNGGSAQAQTGARAVSGKQSGSLGALGTNQQQPWSSTPGAGTHGFNLGSMAQQLPNGNGSIAPTTAGNRNLQAEQQHQKQPSMRSPSLPSALGPLSGLSGQNPRTAVGGGAGSHANQQSSSLSPNTSSSVLGTVPPPGHSQVPQTPAQQVLFSPADRYGLLGLLHIIKTSDPDLSMLALGNDLTSLGLDLGATDNLYSTFITPWADSKAAAALNIEPEFVLPSCYNVQPPPAGTKIGNFSDETLFFIFYSQPRDAMQEMAAHELYKHNWRYHKDLRLWLTKEAGTEPTQKTQSYERGSYIFFDPNLWQRLRKDFVLVFESLESARSA